MSEPKRDFSRSSPLNPIQQQHTSGPIPKPQLPASSANASAQEAAAERPRPTIDATVTTVPTSSSLTELDAPTFERLRSAPVSSNDNAISGVRPIDLPAHALPEAEAASDSVPALANSLAALTDAEAIPDSDAAALEGASESVASPKPATEPNVSTRPQTHVSDDMLLDGALDLPPGEIDPRQRLAWRFKAAFTAWKLLLPACSPEMARGQLLEEMRRYERLLRESGPEPKNKADKQLSDALHLQLNEAKTAELDRALSELEGLLLAADASISQEAFKARWNRDHTDLRQLLRYARFLACRRFGVGYRRDRFEALALELLTLRLPSGRLQLMPRRRAGQVMRQLLRGLYQPSSGNEDSKQAIAHMREELDRLDTITSAKQFFDSGLYLDIYGYKISRHDRILSPEFLYLSIAIEVDVHNLLLSWSQTNASESGKPFSLAPLQLQLRAQKEAAQAVFNDFHKPLAGSAAPAKAVVESKKPQRSQPVAQPRAAAAPAVDRALWRYVAAGIFAVGALGANLFVTGTVRLREPPQALTQAKLLELSPLLVNGRLSSDGKNLSGSLSRRNWVKLTPRQRTEAADAIASELKRRGIDHAELLAYKSRAIQIDYGSVVYVDDSPTRSPAK
ncbi:MAG TPA: hypothetical protein VFN67_15130 [Polyangiales bacterium]|nr:hypothetical protein [Polyangiales bacterium]